MMHSKKTGTERGKRGKKTVGTYGVGGNLKRCKEKKNNAKSKRRVKGNKESRDARRRILGRKS